jgi:phosphoglycerate dehydrogenase-like enzyme
MTARRVVFNMQDERPVWAPPPDAAATLRSALPPDARLVEVGAAVSGRGDGGGVSGAALEAVRGAEVYLGLGLPHELLLAALEPPARLRWVHSGAAGVASLLHPELHTHSVLLTNSAGVHGPAMAESVLAMMLHFARGLDHAVRAQQRCTWDTAPFERADGGIREVAGATVGIIGYGGVGREVAARARALGMDVLALRRRSAATEGAGVRVLYGPAALEALLAASDYVVLTLPSTAATRGLIGRRELELMRKDAVLINVARGDVVDEDALADVLRDGRLRGAALDVFATEPLPPQSPLWSLDNVLLTPHVSATTMRYWQRELELVLDNLRRYFGGKPLRNVVDTAAGY